MVATEPPPFKLARPDRAGDIRGKYLAALDAVHAARKAAEAAEVALAAGSGNHEDADRLRAEADAAAVAVLSVRADAAEFGTFLLQAATAHESTRQTFRSFLAGLVRDLMQPEMDQLTARVADLETVVAREVSR